MRFWSFFWRVVKAGGWAPLTVLGMHLFLNFVVNAYDLWPPTDVPMHFAGGMAIAFIVSQLFRRLPRHAIPRSRLVVLELLLIATLTATAAVTWEFGEFTLDHVVGTNVQLSLANTMKDLAVGIAGGAAIMLIRAGQLRAGFAELRELALDLARRLSA